MLNGLDLCTGIGGIQLGLSPWVSPIAYCEIDRYCQGVLLSLMESGLIPRAPIWDDIRTIERRHVRREIDFISAGFPCQDISLAGDGAGLEGERSGLFFEVIRLVRELRPRFVFLENVPAITIRGLDRILLEFTALGYECRWTIVSAREVGAKHLRERWFLLAQASGESLRLPEPRKRNQALYVAGTLEDGKAPNPNRQRMALGGASFGLGEKQPFALDLLEGDNWDEYARFLLRVDHGVPNRGERIRALGNSVVPQAARKAFKRLSGIGGG